MQDSADPSLPLEPSIAHALVGAVLVLSSVAVFPALRALAQRLFPARQVVFARWGFFHVGLALLTYFGLMLTGGYALRAAGVDLGESGIGAVLFGATLQLCTVALVLLFAHRLDPDGVLSLGLRKVGSFRSAGLGLAAYAAAVPALVGAAVLSQWAWSALGVDAPRQELLRLVLDLSGAERAVFLAFAIVVGPLLEELFFRAFLQPLLVQNLGDRGGVAVTAVLFAAVHGNLFAFLPIFVLALTLGMLMLRTQRLAGCWLVHALHNGLTLALILTTDFGRQLAG